MYLFCTQCGAQNPEDALHCSSCGAAMTNPAVPPQPAPMPTPEQQPAPQPEPQYIPQPAPQQTVAQPVTTVETPVQPRKSNLFKKLLIPLIAGVTSFFMLIMIILLIVILSSNNMEKPIDRYFDALVSADAEKYLKAYPEAFREYLEDDDFDIDDLQDYMDEFLDETEDDTGKKIKARFEVTDKTQLSSSRLNDLKARLNNRYDMPRRDLTDAWEVDVDVLFSGKRDDVDFTLTLIVIRYDGKWYICPDEFSDFIYFPDYYY